MTEGRRFANISLVGFMGTGKSTVGQIVAAMLHFRFLDTDEMIERTANRKISEIFAQDGEPAFRSLEREVVEKLTTMENCVISTGGGLILNPDNLASLKTHALVVCLWSSAETIFKRVSHQPHRPLLQVPDPLGKVRALLQERSPAYRQSDVLLSSEYRTPREVAVQVVQNFRAVSALRVLK